MRLFRLVELAHVIRADERAGRLNWNDVFSAGERTGAARFLYPSLTLVDRLAPGVVDAHVLRELHGASTWMIRRVVRRLAPAGGPPRRDTITTFMWADGTIGLLRALIARFLGSGEDARVRRWIRLLDHVRAGGIRIGGEERESIP